MAKKETVFVCQQCGHESAKWLGKCPSCDAWASFVEFKESKSKSSSRSSSAPKEPQYLKDVPKDRTDRIKTNIAELDLVLGGGLVGGQVVLLAGEPGIGKSTLVLELADKIAPSLYVSGEESIAQIKLRADRMGVMSNNTAFLEETNIDTILSSLEKLSKNTNVRLLIIDSVQTMYSDELVGVPGSVGQVKEVAFRAIRFAKQNNIPVIIIGHVTKEGTVAGPSTLAHMVDTVLWFEGDKLSPLRILRSVKNRFASTDEVGIFQMGQKGLESADISKALFVSDREGGTVGSVVSCMMEGTRPILVEVQSLVVPSKLAFPRRVIHGIDTKKAELIIAILTRYGALRLSEQDVFVNIVGGIKVKDPGIDLAVAMAVASSYKNKPLPKSMYVVGEIGLLGEIRHTEYQDKRIARLTRQGFKSGISSEKFSLVRQALASSFK